MNRCLEPMSLGSPALVLESFCLGFLLEVPSRGLRSITKYGPPGLPKPNKLRERKCEELMGPRPCEVYFRCLMAINPRQPNSRALNLLHG